jgi:hypothetical protein
MIIPSRKFVCQFLISSGVVYNYTDEWNEGAFIAVGNIGKKPRFQMRRLYQQKPPLMHADQIADLQIESDRRGCSYAVVVRGLSS